MSRIQGNGYDGYSMSNNARTAYEDGEKPKSKWTKAEILKAVEDIDASKVDLVRKVNAETLRNRLLIRTSWHHTSKMYNATDFYDIDVDKVQELTAQSVSMWAKSIIEKPGIYSFKGDIHYLEWGGTRNHPRATEKVLENVDIQRKGQFYIVLNNQGREILRKKIDSNGTWVVDYSEEKRKAKEIKEQDNKRRQNSSRRANIFYNKMKGKLSRSSSGNLYVAGRKPSRLDYEKGVEHFFKKGEKRLAPNSMGGYNLEIWGGNNWLTEEQYYAKDEKKKQTQKDGQNIEILNTEVEKDIMEQRNIYGLIYNWKGLKEENSLYFEEELKNLDEDFVPEARYDGAISGDKTYMVIRLTGNTSEETDKNVRDFLTGKYNETGDMPYVEGWYWETVEDNFFIGGENNTTQEYIKRLNLRPEELRMQDIDMADRAVSAEVSNVLNIYSNNQNRLLAQAWSEAEMLATESGEPYVVLEECRQNPINPTKEWLHEGSILSLSEADNVFDKINEYAKTYGGNSEIGLSIWFKYQNKMRAYKCEYVFGAEEAGLVDSISRKSEENGYSEHFKAHLELSKQVDKAIVEGLSFEEQINTQSYVVSARKKLNIADKLFLNSSQNQSYIDSVRESVEKEYQTFFDTEMSKTKEEIFNNNYMIRFYDELHCFIDSEIENNLRKSDIKALSQDAPHILSELYAYYLSSEFASIDNYADISVMICEYNDKYHTEIVKNRYKDNDDTIENSGENESALKEKKHESDEIIKKLKEHYSGGYYEEAFSWLVSHGYVYIEGEKYSISRDEQEYLLVGEQEHLSVEDKYEKNKDITREEFFELVGKYGLTENDFKEKFNEEGEFVGVLWVDENNAAGNTLYDTYTEMGAIIESTHLTTEEYDKLVKANQIASNKGYTDRNTTYYYVWSSVSNNQQSYYVDYYRYVDENVVRENKYYGAVTREELNKAISKQQGSAKYTELDEKGIEFFDELIYQQNLEIKKKDREAELKAAQAEKRVISYSEFLSLNQDLERDFVDNGIDEEEYKHRKEVLATYVVVDDNKYEGAIKNDKPTDYMSSMSSISNYKKAQPNKAKIAADIDVLE